MSALIGIAIGLAVHFFIIRPIEQRKARMWCKEHGLVPDENQEDS